MAIQNRPTDRPHLNGDSSAPAPTSARLHLGLLPRFHPANFPSANSSSAVQSFSKPLNIPGASSPRLRKQPLQPNISNRPHQNGPQEQLYTQQKDIVNTRYNSYQSSQLSPHLASMTIREPTTNLRLRPREVSPGPMTPLDLEDRDEYDFPSGTLSKQSSEEDKDEVLDSYIVTADGTTRPSSPIDRRISRSPLLVVGKKGDATRHRSHLAR